MFWFSVSEFANNIVRGFFSLTLGLFFYQSTGELWAFAFSYMTEFLVSIFLQGIAGSAVDKFGAKAILMRIMALTVTLLFLINVVVDDISKSPLLLFVVVIIMNISRPFIRNSVFTMIPRLAEIQNTTIEKLNGITSVAIQGGQIIGMVLAGVIMELKIGNQVVSIVTLGFAISWSCYFIIFRSYSHNYAEKNSRNDKSWADVILFVREKPMLFLFFIISALDYAAIAIFNLLLAPVVTHNFENASRWLIILDLTFAIGAILGGVHVIRKKFAEPVMRYTLFSMLFALLTFLCYFLNASYYFILPLIFLFGYMVSFSTVVWSTAIQNISPFSIKGRISSLRFIILSIIVMTSVSVVSLANQFGFNISTVSATIYIIALTTSVLLVKVLTIRKMNRSFNTTVV